MSDENESVLPTGRLGRLARLAAVGARTGAGMLIARDATPVAEAAAEVLGNMRGLAAKIGQMASYVDGVMPEAHGGAFEKALSKLRTATPSSPFPAIRKTIESELGAPLAELFATFDEVPFASASIGQVHRATLADGREVAVKVQHPGIETAIASDLDNGAVMERLIGAVGGAKLESKRIYQEIRERFEEELDYRKEAAHQRFFGDLATRRHPKARVPDVIAERSSERVLTSTFVRGKTFEEACLASEAERTAWAYTMWSFTFDATLQHGRFHADPHPGNFFFHDDGVVTFLDFGCVQPFEGAIRDAALRMHRTAAARDEAGFADAVRAMLGTRGGSYEKVVIAYTRRCFEPLFRSPFRFTRAYAAEVVKMTGDMKQDVMFSRDGSFVTLPPGMILLNRLQFGFYSLLARLDCEVDYVEIEAQFLDRK